MCFAKVLFEFRFIYGRLRADVGLIGISLTKRIAVIGSGISGLVSCHLLSERFDVSLFEANDCLGGHTHTHTTRIDQQNFNIDTGFIVFNKRTYPNFCRLLEKLNVPVQLSEMSFSYASKSTGFEYNGHNLNTLFADRINLFKPSFYRFIKEILLFNADAKQWLAQAQNMTLSIKDYLEQRKYSKQFVDCYLIPMMAAIWSKNKADTLHCSAYFIFKFYANHGLLDSYNRPPWYVISQGSKTYIEPMLKNLSGKIYLNHKIETIHRDNNQIILKSKSGEQAFDLVVIATHSDQALDLLSAPNQQEVLTLSSIKYSENEVVLHTDAKVMPKHKRAWASWNYLDNGSEMPTLTYYMNRLQSIRSSTQFFVSLNLGDFIDQNKVIKRFNYAHPCLDVHAITAQQDKKLINGNQHTYYAGSYWGYGFHEDGVNSAISTCRLIEETYA